MNIAKMDIILKIGIDVCLTVPSYLARTTIKTKNSFSLQADKSNRQTTRPFLRYGVSLSTTPSTTKTKLWAVFELVEWGGIYSPLTSSHRVRMSVQLDR